MRILFFLLLLFLVLTLLRSRGRREDTDESATLRPSNSPVQDMVACVHCGVHVPRQDSRTLEAKEGVQYFCSDEHRQRGARNPS